MEKLEFLSKSTDKKKRTRSRKVIWFNPPFSESVKTKVGEKFLLFIDKHFGKTGLRKYFNRFGFAYSHLSMTLFTPTCLPLSELEMQA